MPPLAIVLLALAIIAIQILPRKYVIIPLLLAGILIPLKVSLVIGGLNFNANRMLLVSGLVRLFMRGEQYSGPLNSLDKVFIFSALANAVAFVLTWGQIGAVANRIGYLFTVIGFYILLRSLIICKEDIIRFIKVSALLLIIIAPPMLHEHFTQHNFFAILGAPEFSSVRQGSVRAQGPFGHAIIAGTFGVVLVPLFVGLWREDSRNKGIAVLGIASAGVMMVACASSTPIMSILAGIGALSFWPLRKKMKSVRWMIVLVLVGLQLVMKSPVWFVINRISGVIGGSGWHRTMLIDNFIRHFSEWWLIGTSNNAQWGWSMWDVDNAYVYAGLTGGVIGFVLFLSIFVIGYKMIGAARKAAEESVNERIIWSVGCAFFANTIAFFGIIYFDQSQIAWYALLSIMSILASITAEKAVEPEPHSAMRSQPEVVN